MAVQFHTAGLRQPMLIGKDPAGKKLPGGPYVIWQAAGLLVAPVMWNTADWWAAELGPLGRVILVIGATIAACWALGRIDFAGRNPVWTMTGLLSALWHSATGAGRLRGHRVPARQPPPSGRRTPAVTIGALRPTITPDPDGAEPVPIKAAAVVSNSALASDTTAGPTTHADDYPAGLDCPPSHHRVGVPLVPPAERLSPLEAFLAAGRPQPAGRSDP